MSCIIPANAFVTRQVKLEVLGDYLNNKGSDGVITFRGKLTDSAATDTVTATITVPSNASRKNFVATLTITPTGTNTQSAFLAIQSPDDNDYVVAAFTALQAEQLTLEFTAQLDAAHADFEVRRFSATTQVI